MEISDRAGPGDRVAVLVHSVWRRVAMFASTPTVAALCCADTTLHRHARALWAEHRRVTFVVGRRSRWHTNCDNGYLALPLGCGTSVVVATGDGDTSFVRCTSLPLRSPQPPPPPLRALTPKQSAALAGRERAARARRAHAGLIGVRLLCLLPSGTVAVVSDESPKDILTWFVTPQLEGKLERPTVLDCLRGHAHSVRCLAALSKGCVARSLSRAERRSADRVYIEPDLLVSLDRTTNVRCWNTLDGTCVGKWTWHGACSVIAVVISSPESSASRTRCNKALYPEGCKNTNCRGITVIGGKHSIVSYDIANSKALLRPPVIRLPTALVSVVTGQYQAQPHAGAAADASAAATASTTLVAFGFESGALHLWDAEANALLRVCSVPSIQSAICSIVILNNHVVCAHRSGALLVWKVNGDAARCVQLRPRCCRSEPRLALFPAHCAEARGCDDPPTLIVTSTQGGRVSVVW